MPDCEYCGDGRVFKPDETPVGTFHFCVRCSRRVCRLCGQECAELEYHHSSYIFDTGLSVCGACHHEIHHGDGYGHLQPTVTRSQAKEMGINATLLD